MVRSAAFQLSLLMVIGLIFGGVGCYALYRFFVPVIFDRRLESFWKGWKSPPNAIRTDRLQAYAAFTDIHALQIIPETCEQRTISSSGSRHMERFLSDELNLVLRDGSRINVSDHGDIARLRSEAKQISAFLGRPLWDATL